MAIPERFKDEEGYFDVDKFFKDYETDPEGSIDDLMELDIKIEKEKLMLDSVVYYASAEHSISAEEFQRQCEKSGERLNARRQVLREEISFLNSQTKYHQSKSKECEKNIKQHDKSIKQHDKSIKQHDKSIKQLDESIKQHDKVIQQCDKDIKASQNRVVKGIYNILGRSLKAK